MRTLSRLLVLGLSLHAASPATAGSPVLAVQSRCAESPATPGGTIQVPIALTADGALPAVSGLDFTLTYNPATLVVQSVTLSDAVAALGGWDSPATAPTAAPGTLPVLVAPKLQVPLPTFPAGPVVVVTFAVAASAPAQCTPLALNPGSVVFSAPPLGLAVPGAPPQDGGVEVTGPPPPEICDDCIDNDGDGKLDLADPDCGAGSLTVTRASASGGKPRTTADDRVTLHATLPGALPDLTGGMHVLVAGTGMPLVCQSVPGAAFKGNHKRTRFTYRHAGAGLVLLRLASHQGQTAVVVMLKGLPLGSGERTLALSLAAGTERHLGSVTLRPVRKKLIFP